MAWFASVANLINSRAGYTDCVHGGGYMCERQPAKKRSHYVDRVYIRTEPDLGNIMPVLSELMSICSDTIKTLTTAVPLSHACDVGCTNTEPDYGVQCATTKKRASETTPRTRVNAIWYQRGVRCRRRRLNPCRASSSATA